MAHMKLKKIPKKKKIKYIFLITILYLMFAYTFYNSFKNNEQIMNKEFINFILNNGNANFQNEYKLPKVINKTINYLLKIDITKPDTVLNQRVIGYNHLNNEDDEYKELEKVKEISYEL